MLEECAKVFWKNAREFFGRMRGCFLEECAGIFRKKCAGVLWKNVRMFLEECAGVLWKNARMFLEECTDVFGRMRGSILYACILHNFKLSNDRFSDFAK
jgi:hypothetical protein